LVLPDLLPKPQFPAGESPFHARGLVFLGAQSYYDANVPGGLDAVLGALPTGQLHAFFRQTFLASSWYDILPIVPISATAAKVIGIPHRDLIMANARNVARRDIPTIYKLLLRLSSPEAVVLRMPKASMRYFDFGESTSSMKEPRLCEAYQKGIPRELAGWFFHAAEGFTEVALGLAGAHDIKVRLDSTTVDGERKGAPTVTLKLEMSWTD
jgi:hypothetical protein